MCYASPGPRCFGHATEKYQKSQEKLAQLEAESKVISEEAKTLAEKNPTGYKHGADYKKLQKRAAANSSKIAKQKTVVRDDRIAMDATLGGIESINNRLAELNPAVPEQKSEHYDLTLRSHFAKANYDYKILSYDYTNGTVNGRAPSGYGSDEGIKILQNRVRALDNHPVEEAGPKKERWEAKRAALVKQIAHAKDTKKHAQAKITDLPSATLEENKAQLQKVYFAQNQTNERYDAAYTAYSEGPEKKKQEFLKLRKAEGTPNRVQWSAPDRGKWEALSNEAEVYWEENVKPYSIRKSQLERKEEDLREKIRLGSITPKQRTELKSGKGITSVAARSKQKLGKK